MLILLLTLRRALFSPLCAEPVVAFADTIAGRAEGASAMGMDVLRDESIRLRAQVARETAADLREQSRELVSLAASLRHDRGSRRPSEWDTRIELDSRVFGRESLIEAATPLHLG